LHPGDDARALERDVGVSALTAIPGAISTKSAACPSSGIIPLRDRLDEPRDCGWSTSRVRQRAQFHRA